MFNPLEHTRSELTPRRMAPWGVFTVVLALAVVAFFVYFDRVPSLMQALADH